MLWQSVSEQCDAYDSGRRLIDMIAVCGWRAVKRCEGFLRVGRVVVSRAKMEEVEQEMLDRCWQVECDAEREMNAPVAE